MLLQVGEEGGEGFFALEGLDEVLLPIFWVCGDSIGVPGDISALYILPVTSIIPLGLEESRRYLPIRCIRNIDTSTFHDFRKVIGVPQLHRRPRRSPFSNDEGAVLGYVAHKLEGTGFGGEFIDKGAVKVVVGLDEVFKG